MHIMQIDGLQYKAEDIPVHVMQLFDALKKAQTMAAEKQAELLVANYAIDAISSRVRGAMSVIPPYTPEPEVNTPAPPVANESKDQSYTDKDENEDRRYDDEDDE